MGTRRGDLVAASEGTLNMSGPLIPLSSFRWTISHCSVGMKRYEVLPSAMQNGMEKVRGY